MIEINEMNTVLKIKTMLRIELAVLLVVSLSVPFAPVAGAKTWDKDLVDNLASGSVNSHMSAENYDYAQNCIRIFGHRPPKASFEWWQMEPDYQEPNGVPVGFLADSKGGSGRQRISLYEWRIKKKPYRNSFTAWLQLGPFHTLNWPEFEAYNYGTPYFETHFPEGQFVRNDVVLVEDYEYAVALRVADGDGCRSAVKAVISLNRESKKNVHEW